MTTKPEMAINLNTGVSSGRSPSSVVVRLSWGGELIVILIPLLRRAITPTQLVSYSVVDVAEAPVVTNSAYWI